MRPNQTQSKSYDICWSVLCSSRKCKTLTHLPPSLIVSALVSVAERHIPFPHLRPYDIQFLKPQPTMAAYDYEDAPGTYDETSATQRQASSGAPPSQDLGYDPNFVPDSVKSFVVHLYRHIREKNVYEIHQMYETSFQTLSDRLFKDTPWPSVDAVAHYVDNDHVFCLLYREMWFRHLYARLSPTLKQRIDSWDNYCSLFQVVLHGVVNMQLPNQWLWDMVDEFVYQFQSFCQYRAKMKNKTEQEIALLRQFDQVRIVTFISNLGNIDI